MSKFSCYPSEWYPVLELMEPIDDEAATFTLEEIADIRRVMDDFNRIQRMMFERFKKTGFEEWSLGPPI